LAATTRVSLIRKHFRSLKDPRVVGRTQHRLIDIIVMALCGVIANTEAHYFIGSRRMGARRYAQALRSHWGIENNLHWQLDVSFREAANQVENRHGAANLAMSRVIASNRPYITLAGSLISSRGGRRMSRREGRRRRLTEE